MQPIAFEGAFDLLGRLSHLFNTPIPKVAFDCEECFTDPNIIGCYIVESMLICFRSEALFEDTVAHEFGHYLWHTYYGPNCPSDIACERFARVFESLYMAGAFDWSCEVCGGGQALLVGLGNFQCLNCLSQYRVQAF